MAEHRDELSPSYSWYIRDWRASHRVSMLSWKERGFYRELLDWSWDLNGFPNDLPFIQRRLRATTPDFQKLWQAVKSFYVVAEDGRLRNPRQELERRKQTTNRKRSSDGGIAKSLKQTLDIPGDTTALRSASGVGEHVLKAGALGSAFHAAPLSPVPSPVLVPSLSLDAGARARSLVDDDIGDRAGRLVERYQELFFAQRHGARYRPRPAFDWQDACELCRVWPDERLEKLATLVLTTDDVFIAKTDRSFKIFAMKASWADDRLRQWEVEHGVTA